MIAAGAAIATCWHCMGCRLAAFSSSHHRTDALTDRPPTETNPYQAKCRAGPARHERRNAAPSRGSLLVIFLTVFIDLLGLRHGAAAVADLCQDVRRGRARLGDRPLDGQLLGDDVYLLAAVGAAVRPDRPAAGADRGPGGSAVFYALFGLATRVAEPDVAVRRADRGGHCRRRRFPRPRPTSPMSTTRQDAGQGDGADRRGVRPGIHVRAAARLGGAGVSRRSESDVGDQSLAGLCGGGAVGRGLACWPCSAAGVAAAGSDAPSHHAVFDWRAWADAFTTPSIPRDPAHVVRQRRFVRGLRDDALAAAQKPTCLRFQVRRRCCCTLPSSASRSAWPRDCSCGGWPGGSARSRWPRPAAW